MNTKMGMITDVQRFSLNDGPGIRTTVFLKGCPLRCLWCHNPECLSPSPQIRLLADRCVRCGACKAVCPKGAHGLKDAHVIDRSACIGCGLCAEGCLQEALLLTGRRMSAEKVMDIVRRDKRYYDTSGGGLTVSGGEPTMQPDFLMELLSLARNEGIHTAVETSGFCNAGLLMKIAPLTDLFLYDCKETDAAQHRLLTGVDNAEIVSNLKLLTEQGANVILRCPLIPGENLREAHLQGIIRLLEQLKGILACELMAYHRLGRGKYGELGMACSVDAQELTPAQREEILDWMKARSPVPVRFG